MLGITQLRTQANKSRGPMPGLLLTALLLLTGCDSDAARFANGEVLVFQGTFGDEDQQHDFVLTHRGIVSLELTEISVTDTETGDSLDPPPLSVSLGRPSLETCRPTLTRSLRQGGAFAVFLQAAAYCLRVPRPSLPEDAVASYTLTLSGAS